MYLIFAKALLVAALLLNIMSNIPAQEKRSQTGIFGAAHPPGEIASDNW